MTLVRKVTTDVLGMLVASAVILSTLFVAFAWLPTDAADVTAGADTDRAEILRQERGLHQPVAARLIGWWMGALRADFGKSWDSGADAGTLVLEGLLRTVAIALPVWFFAIAVGTILATILAWMRHHFSGKAGSSAVTLVVALPEVVWVVVWMALLASLWPHLPRVSILPPGTQPWDQPSSMVLPMAALCVPAIGWTTQMLQGLAEDATAQEVVTSSRARGLHPVATIYRYVFFRVVAAGLPVYAMIGLGVLGGSVIVDSLTAYPGLGTVLVMASAARDIPVLMAALTLLTALSMTLLGSASWVQRGIHAGLVLRGAT